MLKFAGAMIVILSSLGVGYFLGESIRRRIRDIDALADFADFVSSEIAVYKTPLPEIFAKCDDRYLAETGFAGGSAAESTQPQPIRECLRGTRSGR